MGTQLRCHKPRYASPSTHYEENGLKKSGNFGLGTPCFAKKQVQRQAEVAEIKDIVGLPD
jgi:hypothetical protein